MFSYPTCSSVYETLLAKCASIKLYLIVIKNNFICVHEVSVDVLA